MGRPVDLVTGGAGFVGSALVRDLVGRGRDVVVLDDLSTGRAELLDDLAADHVEIVVGDVRAPASFADRLRDAKTVYHLACVNLRRSLQDPFAAHDVNATGTLQLLEAARAVGVGRFVHVSSSEVYGPARTVPMAEDHPTEPTTAYGASKLAGEAYARAHHLRYGMPVVVVRPFNAMGPDAHHEGDSGEVIPRFMLRALAGQAPIVFGDSTHTRDFLVVKDCAEALVRIAETDAVVGDIVNLGYGEETRIGDLGRLVLAATGRTDLQVQCEAERPGDVPRLWVDPAKLRAATGWRPRTTLAEGLRITLDHYRQLYAANPRCLEQMTTRNWEKP